MAEFAVSQDVHVAREAVFDAMADARNETHWNSQVSQVDLLSGEPIGPGTRFRTVNRGQPYDVTITQYERPGDLVFAVSGRQMDITSRVSFTEDGAGTSLRADFSFTPKGAFKLLFPLIRPMVARDMPRQMAGFARFCESRHGSDA